MYNVHSELNDIKISNICYFESCVKVTIICVLLYHEIFNNWCNFNFLNISYLKKKRLHNAGVDEEIFYIARTRTAK
jgi:hypothetical protein